MTTPDRFEDPLLKPWPIAIIIFFTLAVVGYCLFDLIWHWSVMTELERWWLEVPLFAIGLSAIGGLFLWLTRPVAVPGPSRLDQMDHEIAKKLLEDLAVEDAAKAAGQGKLCKDCRFAQHDPRVIASLSAVAWTCSHPTATYHPPPDLVTGSDSTPYQLPCSVARGKGSSYTKGRQCGPEGRYWEDRC